MGDLLQRSMWWGHMAGVLQGHVVAWGGVRAPGEGEEIPPSPPPRGDRSNKGFSKLMGSQDGFLANEFLICMSLAATI